MAAAAPSAEASIKVMEDDLSCNICYNLLREPKDLDCSHVFCLQCLQEWAGNQPTIECPECRYITIVPLGGVANLKTNLRLRSMAERYAERNEMQRGTPLCPIHEGEKQHFFCVTCGETACHNCLVLKHERPQHDVRELKDIAKARKAEVKVKIDSVNKQLKDIEDDETKLDEIGRKLQAARTRADKKVEKHAQKVISEVQAKVKEMKGQIESAYQQRLGILKERQHQTKDKLTRLQDLCTVTQNAVYTTADHVFMKQHGSLIMLIDKMDKLCMTEHKMPSPKLAILKFKPGSTAVNPCFGEILCGGSIDALQSNPQSYPVNASRFGEAVGGRDRKMELKLIKEFCEFRQTYGVAETQSGLLAVVDSYAGKVITYRYVNGEYKQQFILGSSSGSPDGKLKLPSQVAVTSGGKFLVTSLDNWRNVVKIFSLSGRYEKTLTGVGNLITTTSDDLIVTGGIIRTGDSETGVIITVHQPNGELIRTHQVDCKDIADIASNGKQISFTMTLYNKFHVIDFVTGQVVWTVDITSPQGICYEPKTNTLLVAGGSETAGQGVFIEQYCITTGQLISRLASGLYSPWTMTVTHERRLVVADSKTVRIYNIKVQ